MVPLELFWMTPETVDPNVPLIVRTLLLVFVIVPVLLTVAPESVIAPEPEFEILPTVVPTLPTTFIVPLLALVIVPVLLTLFVAEPRVIVAAELLVMFPTSVPKPPEKLLAPPAEVVTVPLTLTCAEKVNAAPVEVMAKFRVPTPVLPTLPPIVKVPPAPAVIWTLSVRVTWPVPRFKLFVALK